MKELFSSPVNKFLRSYPWEHGRSQDFFRGGGNTFSKKFSKNFQKNCKKFSKIFKKSSNIFKKNFKNFQKIFKKISLQTKFWKTFFRKLRKMHYFSIFQKNFNKPCVNFFPFGRKTQIVGKFWENLLKIFIKKLTKMNYFSIFFNRI